MNKLKIILSVTILLLAVSCHKRLICYSKVRNSVITYKHLNDSTLELKGISSDPEFGFSLKKPVMLGLADVHLAAQNIEKYINALQGPNGEMITFKRIIPCCPFKTKNFIYETPFPDLVLDYQHGMLEKYELKYTDDLKTSTVVLFFNLYDETKSLLAPLGFTYKAN